MSLSRRDFLKLSVLTGGALAGGHKITESVASLRASEVKGVEAKYVPNLCELCFWNCNLFAKVVNGKIVGLEGNPLSQRGRGMLCGRGNAGYSLVYNPDRLKKPLINTGKRGDPKFKEVSWDEAISFVAQKLSDIRSKYGGESIALFSHGSGGSWWKHLLGALGSKNIFAPSFANCRGARDVGFYLTFGSDCGSPEIYDIENSKFLMLVGYHLGENAHNSHVQEIMLALSRGAKLVVMDPRQSNIASKAHWWLPVKPGTDLAVLLALINVIISEDLYDKEFVSKYTYGFDKLAEAVKDYTPEWASRESDIPAEAIVQIAREMAKYKPSVCAIGGRFSVWHGNDVQRNRAIAIINGLMGSWGRPGGYYRPASLSVPKYPGIPEYPEAKKPLTGYPFALLPTTTALRKATITGDPYPVKAWIAYSCNICCALPNIRETVEAINKLDLMVVVDIIPNNHMQWADVVLPECTYLERYDDLIVDKMRIPAVSLRAPAIDPLYESRPSWWICKEIANKMGIGEYFPFKDAEEYLKKICEQMNISFDELYQKGIILFPDKAHPYFTDSDPPSFDTPTGKVELYSTALEEAGFDPVPKYTPPNPAPNGYFRLLQGRNPLHTFSRTVDIPILNELYPENELWINTKVAKELGLKEGDYVRLLNQDGVKSTFKVKVKITGRIRPDCVYMVHGFGNKTKELKRAYGKGASDNELFTTYILDPIMGGTGMRVNFVKIIKEG